MSYDPLPCIGLSASFGPCNFLNYSLLLLPKKEIRFFLYQTAVIVSQAGSLKHIDLKIINYINHWCL